MFKQEALIPEMNKLRKFAMKLTRNDSDADDLVQSTLLRALEKRDYFEEGTNLFRWTSKIMFNLFASEYRHKKKFDTQYDPEPYIERASVNASQEAATDLATITRKISKLSDERKSVVTLICFRGLGYEEVAERLDIPVGTVRSRLYRARAELCAMLEERPLTAEQNMHLHRRIAV